MKNLVINLRNISKRSVKRLKINSLNDLITLLVISLISDITRTFKSKKILTNKRIRKTS